MFKKKKIQVYLDNKPNYELNAFDYMLSDYLKKTLKLNLNKIGIEKVEMHIDWLEDYKCIGIQGRFNYNIFVNLQVEEKELNIGYSYDEPECTDTFIINDVLNDANYLYNIVQNQLNKFLGNQYSKIYSDITGKKDLEFEVIDFNNISNIINNEFIYINNGEKKVLKLNECADYYQMPNLTSVNGSKCIGGRYFSTMKAFYAIHTKEKVLIFNYDMQINKFKIFLTKKGWNWQVKYFKTFYGVQQKLASFGYTVMDLT